jgi:hypothetical protein
MDYLAPQTLDLSDKVTKEDIQAGLAEVAASRKAGAIGQCPERKGGMNYVEGFSCGLHVAGGQVLKACKVSGVDCPRSILEAAQFASAERRRK